MEKRTRKLATVKRISKVTKHPNADKLDICTIDGWNVVTKLGEFKENDLCIFFEIDSFLPIAPKYEFLGKPTIYLGKEGYRLKTQKIRQVISQGLALPLSHVNLLDLPVDTDVTDLLGIIKYDREAIEGASGSLKSGQSSGTFPVFIPKTDQTRIQSLTSYFSIHKDTVFEETLKLDGSSLTAYKLAPKPTWWQKLFRITPKPHFGVCSRNQELKRPDNLASSAFWYVADKYTLSNIPEGFAIQGELIGPNIQSNHEKVSDFEFYCFDVFDIKSQKYLTATDRHLFCYQFDIPHVPLVCMTKVLTDYPSIDELLERVDDKSMNPKTISEGRVYKSTTNPSITFKVINNKYLLKEK